MIIGYDGSRAFKKERTGTENYSLELLKALSRVDLENIYKVYVRPGYELGKNQWPKNYQFSVINYQLMWTQAGLSLQTLKDSLDLLFVPGHTLPLVRKPGLKTIMTVHDLGAEYLPGMHQIKQRLYLDFITKFQLKTATKLIAVSQATKKDLIEKVGVDPSKVEVIYEGVDRTVFKPIKGDVLINSLEDYDLKPGSYFLFVGTIQPRKNLKRLIEAYQIYLARGPAAAVSQVRPLSKPSLRSTPESSPPRHPFASNLVLVGSKGWLSDEIYRLPKKLGIEKRVKFLGFVPDQDLPALYSGAIALVFPSLFEGFGLPLLEAFSCGCPVVTSNVSSMPEIAGNAAILVNPYKKEEISQAMIKIQEKKLISQLINAGFKQLKKFSLEKAARETLRLFESL